MTKKWAELEAMMSPESIARMNARAEEMKKEIEAQLRADALWEQKDREKSGQTHISLPL